MPAILRSLTSRSGEPLLVACLAFVLAVSAVAVPAGPAGATDWSARIAATRSSQLAYEGAMRAADQQLHHLTVAGRHARRRAAVARRQVGEARARLESERDARAAAVTRLAAARRELGAELEATTPWRDLQRLPRALRDLSLIGKPWGAASLVDGVPAATPGTLPPATSRLGRLAASVAAQQQELRQQQRAVARARARLRHADRRQRRAVQRLHVIASTRRAAVARREGAESGLGWAILAMSDLARRRVVKKTTVHLGTGSEFAWPALGRISQSYGCTGFSLNPSRGSCAHFHDGLDIAGSLGSSIRAAAVGVVSYVGWNPWDVGRRAFIIVIAHPNGYETVYGHVLPLRHVRVGQLVRRGEAIGAMGSTGRSTGVHLHLELRRGRLTLDPRSVL